MADIFISYAREDAETAQRLAGALAACGWSVWWDRRIPTGRRFHEVIERELTAAGCVISLWSKAAIASAWVREEAQDGLDRDVLVPALIEPVPLPLGFRSVQTTDLSRWQGDGEESGFAQLVADIEELIGPAPKTLADEQQRNAEEARQRAEEEERKRAEAEVKRQAEEEERRRVEAEAKRKAEDERKRREKEKAEARRRVEEEERQRAAAEAERKAEEERQRAAAETERQEEERRRMEAQAQRRVEGEPKHRAEEYKQKPGMPKWIIVALILFVLWGGLITHYFVPIVGTEKTMPVTMIPPADAPGTALQSAPDKITSDVAKPVPPETTATEATLDPPKPPLDITKKSTVDVRGPTDDEIVRCDYRDGTSQEITFSNCLRIGGKASATVSTTSPATKTATPGATKKAPANAAKPLRKPTDAN